jgi:hypothetical protein
MHVCIYIQVKKEEGTTVIAPMDTRQQIMSPENQAEVTVKKKIETSGRPPRW